MAAVIVCFDVGLLGVVERKVDMRSGKTGSTGFVAAEVLEGRVFLSQSPSAAFVGPVPAFAFPDRKLQAVVRVTNPESRSTPIRLNLFASPTPDLSGDSQLLAQSSPITAVRKTVRLPFSSTLVSAGGNFYLVAQLVPAPTRTSPAALEGVAPKEFAAPRPTQFVAPNVDLTAQFAHQPPSPLFVSRQNSSHTSATVVVLNAGTTTAVGTLTAAVYASTVQEFDSSATLIGSAALAHVRIPSATSRTVTVPLTFPAGTPQGTYYLFAVVNPSSAIAETNTANNVTRSLSPLTVTDSLPTPAHHQNHTHIAGGVGIIDVGAVDLPLDWSSEPDNSETSSDTMDYLPPSVDSAPDMTTTAPSTQPTTEPTTQPSDPSSDGSSSDSSGSGDEWTL